MCAGSQRGLRNLTDNGTSLVLFYEACQGHASLVRLNTVIMESMPGTQSISVPHAVPYARACCLLQACATLLRMPPRAVATGIAYLHRWQAVVATDEGSALAEAAAAAAEEGEQPEVGLAL